MPSLTLDEHQIYAVSELTALDRRGLAHPTGAGKTITALEAFRRIKEREAKTRAVEPKLLVIARPMGKLSWIGDMKDYFPQLRYSDMDKPDFNSEANVWLMTHTGPERHNKLLKTLMKLYRVVLCADEAHAYKCTARVHKQADGKSRLSPVMRTHAFEKISKWAFKVWGLTATPFDRREQFHFLLKTFGANVRSEKEFIARYCQTKEIRCPNGKRIQKVTGYTHEGEWKAVVRQAFNTAYPESLRRIPVRVIRIPVELRDNQKRLYQEACRGILLSVPNWENLDDSKLLHEFNSKMEESHRKLQVLSHPRLLPEYSYFPGYGAKYEALLDFLENFWEENPNEKVIVWFTYRGHRELLEEALKKYDPLFISWKENAKQRNAAFEAFNKVPRHKLLCASPGIAGESLNFQFACHTAVYLELSWGLKEWVQTRGRLVRRGQDEIVKFYILTALGTYDEEMFYKVKAKVNDAVPLLHGRDIRLLFAHMELGLTLGREVVMA